MLAAVLRPLRHVLEREDRIPEWAGPDLLRGLAFWIWDEYDRSAGSMPVEVATRRLEPIAWAVNRRAATVADERFRVDRLLVWLKAPAWWVAEVGDGCETSEFGDGTRYRIFESSRGFELWVWAGPAEGEAVLGMMGADLRSQKRAKHLSTHATLRAAKRAGDRDLAKRQENRAGTDR